jgi:hypothetical protein
MDTRDHMTFLTTQWESWQTHVSTSRQFKTQWHQFIQDARKVGKQQENVTVLAVYMLFKKKMHQCLAFLFLFS